MGDLIRQSAENARRLGGIEVALTAFEHGHSMHWEDIRTLLQALEIPRIRIYATGPSTLEALAEMAA